MRKDNRLTFKYERAEGFGNVWHFDAKYDPETKKLKLYRVYGDVTNPRRFEAIRNRVSVLLGRSDW